MGKYLKPSFYATLPLLPFASVSWSTNSTAWWLPRKDFAKRYIYCKSSSRLASKTSSVSSSSQTRSTLPNVGSAREPYHTSALRKLEATIESTAGGHNVKFFHLALAAKVYPMFNFEHIYFFELKVPFPPWTKGCFQWKNVRSRGTCYLVNMIENTFLLIKDIWDHIRKLTVNMIKVRVKDMLSYPSWTITVTWTRI